MIYTTIKSKKIKEKELIIKLFYKMARNNNVKYNSIPLYLKFLGKNCQLNSYCESFFKSSISLEIEKQEIVFSLWNLKDGINSDTYYKGRTEKLNPLLKNNKHNLIRFILLHELKHAIDHRKIRIKSEVSSEINADDFAIKNLKEY